MPGFFTRRLHLQEKLSRTKSAVGLGGEDELRPKLPAVKRDSS